MPLFLCWRQCLECSTRSLHHPQRPLAVAMLIIFIFLDPITIRAQQLKAFQCTGDDPPVSRCGCRLFAILMAIAFDVIELQSTFIRETATPAFTPQLRNRFPAKAHNVRLLIKKITIVISHGDNYITSTNLHAIGLRGSSRSSKPHLACPSVHGDT